MAILRVSSTTTNEDLHQKQLEISKICEDIDKLECAPTAGEVDVKLLLAFRKSLENTCEELKDLKWVP